MTDTPQAQLSDSHVQDNPDLQRLLEARHHDPFAVLGRHEQAGETFIRILLPYTCEVMLEDTGEVFRRVGNSDIFEWRGQGEQLPAHYRLRRIDSEGGTHLLYDTYAFGPTLSEYDLNLFSAGKHLHVYRMLGAHACNIDGIDGVRFATWAPNAERVSVIGNFNRWDGRCYPMRARGSSGVWELFIPELPMGELYKYEIRNRDTGKVVQKSDPYARQTELRPRTASVIFESDYTWQDESWLAQRQAAEWLYQPMSIYEVHLGSWQRGDQGETLDYRELAHRMVEYVTRLGFTHIELMPITEHPFDDSWGYQTTGYYAPTARHGDPDGFRYFVDYCHQHDIGVLLDWVPAHFPRDEFALAYYDGSALYEHEDPRRGAHPDWGTLIYNYGRNEVRNFLISSAIFWLQEYHLDGLRVDAVASMLYLDYSKEKADEWLPNIHGGNENLEAISFLREMNTVTHQEVPGTLIMAEESTAWPQVTRPVELGGLGFSMKWNMGWMHDILEYFSQDPVHRRYHHDKLTFGLIYLFTENFILPFSHDEVVHGKSSLLYKMPGDEWRKFANLRLLYTFMYTYPGKKLLFMGCEFGQGPEWNAKKQLEWHVLEYPVHHGLQKLVGDLNHLYRRESALNYYDFDYQGFEWIDCHDSEQSIISFLRKSDDRFVVVILNFTPVPRYDYRIGVPQAGRYREIHNSDSEFYAGSNVGNQGELHTTGVSWMGRPDSLSLTLPPLAGIVLEYLVDE
ncbi:MAG: 1,4-alpha-glucan branching protein GlgB [Thiohalophilus sp.]|uniref:1,4-alpha-glucan branching protein GlgB n=1 Tax=Thiohalophilus sp. TaxID=3028392 RepID=UPI0028707668|nr:1,4-alpha-glucan branching protein GlgB [Thiohalophilus sp.]MDR9435916.1 1,4-alpha-glucan branching protein GlgB [Thiohalophilus sp.]